MSTRIADAVIEWNVLAEGPADRMRAAWEYALCIFRAPHDAAAWFSKPSPSVAEGKCTVGQACGRPDGFVETIGALIAMSTSGKPLPTADGATPVTMLFAALPIPAVAAGLDQRRWSSGTNTWSSGPT